jgi:uncharacterized protein (TIGR00251 family)
MVEKSGKGKSKGPKVPRPQEEVKETSVYFNKSGALMLVLNVKPNSKSDQILAVDDSAVSLSIRDPARDGQANDAVVAFIAETLDIRKYNVQIVKGHKSH